MTRNKEDENTTIWEGSSVLVPLANLRDLGGIPVATGFVRPNSIYRSDDLSLSPRDEIQDLVNLGLTTVMDLRSPDEQALRPHTNLGGLGIAYHELSFINDAIDPQRAAARMTEIADPLDLGRWYAQMAEDASEIMVRGLEILAFTSGATLFHCAAGKDRTGVFSASILAVLGANDEEIIQDYARTDLVIANVLTRLAIEMPAGQGNLHQWNPEQFNSDSPLLRAHAEAARSMLDELQSRHGGMIQMLQNAGLTDSIKDRLLNQLVV